MTRLISLSIDILCFNELPVSLGDLHALKTLMIMNSAALRALLESVAWLTSLQTLHI